MTNAIALHGVTKRYADQSALAGIDLTVEPGAFCVLLGPSGCGKSTLLRMLAGLETPNDGEIAIGGRTVAAPDRSIHIAPGARDLGMVFQSYALWPHKTVADNITWPLKVAGQAPDSRKARLREVAGMLNIGPYLARYPAELSGGQQQRVAIARSIAPKPGLLLFDEPLSNLDAQLRVEMRTELQKLHRATGATIVYVTHDQVEAMTMATQIVVMQNGLIEQNGTTDDLLRHPQTAFVAGFVGNPPANLLTMDRGADGWQISGTPVSPPGQVNGHESVRMMVRPQAIRLVSEPGANRIAARIVEALPFGAQHFVQMESSAGRITALVDDASQCGYGHSLFAEVPDQPEALFDTVGARIA